MTALCAATSVVLSVLLSLAVASRAGVADRSVGGGHLHDAHDRGDRERDEREGEPSDDGFPAVRGAPAGGPRREVHEGWPRHRPHLSSGGIGPTLPPPRRADIGGVTLIRRRSGCVIRVAPRCRRRPAAASSAAWHPRREEVSTMTTPSIATPAVGLRGVRPKTSIATPVSSSTPSARSSRCGPQPPSRWASSPGSSHRRSRTAFPALDTCR